MRKLKVDLEDLAMAFEDASWERSHYLDLETGRVIMWVAQDAREVEVGLGTRYVEVPTIPSYEGYRDMEAFIAGVQDKRLQDHLSRAIQGQGAFYRFKAVLASHPGERQRWFEFKDSRMRQRVIDWLESEGIEPIEDAEVAARRLVKPPPARPKLITEALLFVRAASRLPGVIRIALMGSLTTDKADPKDADLLVTVTDDADLTPLATLARKLQGRAQSFNRGGDVFLADPKGNHLGRTCDWKECAPGIRQSCDALHCGQRHYLHDDLGSVRLPKLLIAEPPIELWPQVLARVPIPPDIEEGLLAPLKEELPGPK